MWKTDVRHVRLDMLASASCTFILCGLARLDDVLRQKLNGDVVLMDELYLAKTVSHTSIIIYLFSIVIELTSVL